MIGKIFGLGSGSSSTVSASREAATPSDQALRQQNQKQSGNPNDPKGGNSVRKAVKVKQKIN